MLVTAEVFHAPLAASLPSNSPHRSQVALIVVHVRHRKFPSQLSQHNFHLHRHFRLPFCSRHSITKFFYIALYKYRYEGDEGRSRRTQGQCKPRPRWNDELTARLRLSVTRVREGTPALPKTCTPLVPRGTIEAGTDLRYTGMVL